MANNSTTVDVNIMRKAILLACRGGAGTSPNPNVGAVIVKGDRIIGEGWHEKAGEAHAEINAIRAAGRHVKGSTLYVTLEPCSTWGRTGPCTEAIIHAGIKRVVIGTTDPNPGHRGKGIRILKNAGIKVTSEVCSDEARGVIETFAKWITTGMPFVTLKMAMSLDGRVSDCNGRSKWITSDFSRKIVKWMRGSADAVMVGAGTVLADDPKLYPEGGHGQPFRIIVDSKGRTPLSSRVLSDRHSKRTIMAVSGRCAGARVKAFEKKGARVIRLPEKKGKVSLIKLIRELGKLNILHVICEGGPTLANELYRNKLVDKYIFFMAPIILGNEGALPVFNGRGLPLDETGRLKIVDMFRTDMDLVVKAIPVR